MEKVVLYWSNICVLHKQVQQSIEEAQEMLNDPEMKELAEEELYENKEKLPKIEEELKILLIPKDPDDDKNIIMCGVRFMAETCKILSPDKNVYLPNPEKSDEWLKYVNTRKVDGRIEVKYRNLVGRGETYEHSN